MHGREPYVRSEPESERGNDEMDSERTVYSVSVSPRASGAILWRSELDIAKPRRAAALATARAELMI